MNTENYFDDIEASFVSARLAFEKSMLMEDEGNLRSLSSAKEILEAVKEIYYFTYASFEDDDNLLNLIQKKIGPINDFEDREILLEVCFLDEFIFPSTETFPLVSSEDSFSDLLKNYIESFKSWCTDISEQHKKSQESIKNNFSLKLSPSDLTCDCNKCVADFRNKVRDELYKEQVKLIDEGEEELHDYILEHKIDQVSKFVSRLKGELDQNLHKSRYKLRRSSLNKLESDIKNYFKSKFSHAAPLGSVYKEKLRAYFNQILVDKEIKLDLVSEQEFTRFFTLLNIGIWKEAHILKREFLKFTDSVLAFKRKDISATILKEYLGQFWLHAEARKKKRRVIYHMGPTNSGKTYHAIEALAQAKNGSYLAPLRLLASELYDTLSGKGVKVTLLTGEEVIEAEGATHYSSTIEMAKLNDEFECCVIDEIQMITDPQRGWAWTRALINMNAREIHLCGDSSVLDLVKKILKLTGDDLEVNEYTRMTTLSVEKTSIRLNQLQKNDALIVFSRRNALKYKMDLENLGFKVSIVYGRLSPEVRREQARKFDSEETDIMVSTDAIAMGMNLPVRRIVFSTLSKFIDNKEYIISPSEIKQIAGRAGRFKRFPEGQVTVLQKVEGGLELVADALSCKLDQKETAMVGPDLEIFKSVNNALNENRLPELTLSEFLRLFNTMTFIEPFYCVDLKEMIELSEMVESADVNNVLSLSEKFGFACAPVNLGLQEHVQYYVWMLTHFVNERLILNDYIDNESNDIDYLETSIKCVELYQWLARHFDNKNFDFDEADLLNNKAQAVEKLNSLLSEKTSKRCSSCGANLPDEFRFNICEECFGSKNFRRGRPQRGRANTKSTPRPKNTSQKNFKKKKNSKKPFRRF